MFSFVIGYWFYDLSKTVKDLSKVTWDRLQPKSEEPQSVFIDPDDLARRVKYEHEEMMKELNPHE